VACASRCCGKRNQNVVILGVLISFDGNVISFDGNSIGIVDRLISSTI
jgi:hypothetical protein